MRLGRKKRPPSFRVEGNERIYTAESKGIEMEFRFSIDFPIIDSSITVSNQGYATVYRDGKMKKLHRLALEWYLGREIKRDYTVDHISGDISDNTRDNLREATQRQNSQNTKSKGYSWDSKRNKWQVRLMVEGKSIWIGRFDTENEAKEASDKARLKYFGEYARQSLIA